LIPHGSITSDPWRQYERKAKYEGGHGGFFTWLIPLLVSFGLYNPKTGVYVPSYWEFKLIMAAVAAVACIATYRWIERKQQLSSTVPAAYLALNSVLDLILLVALFGMPFQDWLITVFPIYVTVFFVIWFYVKAAEVRA
jgi:hypothetical protein